MVTGVGCDAFATQQPSDRASWHARLKVTLFVDSRRNRATTPRRKYRPKRIQADESRSGGKEPVSFFTPKPIHKGINLPGTK